MEDLYEILDSFESVNLAEMDSVKLMDRFDTRYSLTSQQLASVLPMLKQHYKVVNIAGTKITSYKTLYFDTAALDLYLAQHNRRAGRYKIRHRYYVESKLGFLEVKFKNNKGRTIKTRISQNEDAGKWNEEARQFISENSDLDPDLLELSLQVNYRRITLVDAAERVTIDFAIEFKKNGLRRILQNLVIIELKQNRKKPSVIFEIVRKEKLLVSPVSKYCLGIASMMPDVKQNNFRQKIRLMTKMTDI